jgi:hypothetical protein
MDNPNYKMLIEMRENIVNYLMEEVERNQAALKTYDDNVILDSDPEIRRMREVEAIKLRTEINKGLRDVAVIKKMFPNQ